MARSFIFAFVVVSALGQDSIDDTHDDITNITESCFPACPVLQCTGIYGARVGPQERWVEVVEWAKKKAPGVVVDDRIVMAPGKWGYEVTATADQINKGEVLLRLPLEMALLEEDCFPTESFTKLGSKYVSSLSKLPSYTWNSSEANGADFTQAGLCLLVHRLLGEDSPYAAYIRHLPLQSSGETYLFRDFPDFESLKGTDAYRVVSVMRKRHLALLDKAIDPGLKMLREYFPSLNWTEKDMRFHLQQTLSLCGSRTFNVDSDMFAPSDKPAAKLYRPALVPLLDMFNHGDAHARNCQYHFVKAKQQFHLVATRDIKAGEELIHSYGPRTNAELLFFYGFMIPGNVEDYVSVADFTAGAIEYNFHSALGRSLRCYTPFFRSIDGSEWPPSYWTVINNASAYENAQSILEIGPLYPSVFHSFKRKLEQQPRSVSLVDVFRQLALRSGDALLKLVNGEFTLSQKQGSKEVQRVESSTRGNLTVELLWWGSPRPTFCKKSKCEEFAPGVGSVSEIVTKLKQGLFPALARAGGCLMWSERKQHMYEIKQSSDGTWTSVVTVPRKLETSLAHQASVLREFELKRTLIRAAGLEHFTAKVFRKGVLPETLASIRIAVLPELSSFAIHQILSGKRLSPELEQQVARTLGVFCFEELTRRLQALGFDTEIERLSLLLHQARSALQAEGEGSYEALARSELGIVTDFCSGVASWDLSLWD